MTDPKKDELTELKARVAELERAAAPPKPYIDDWVPPPHPIDRVSMSPSAMREFAEAVPDNLLRDIVHDNRGPLTPCSPGAVPPSVPVSRPVGSGWREASPLTPPPGIGLVDRLLEVDAAKQRGEAMIKEAKIKAAESK